MAFHQATLTAAPRHPLAANDLAVLLAQAGRWSEAARWFSYSLSIQSNAAAWNNLAVVQAKLEQLPAAQQSERASLAASRGSRAAVDPALAPWLAVQWLNPSSFANTSAPATDQNMTTPAAAEAAAPKVPNRAPIGRPEIREARRPTWNN